jgi:hypothetical protein
MTAKVEPAGAKAGILALGDRDFAESLRQRPRADAKRTAALVAGIFPGYQVEPVQGWPLTESTYPDDDVAYALSAPGIDIMCDRRFMLDRPSELPGHVLGEAAGRRVALCAVHSVDDSLAYAVWADGELVRSLSVVFAAPDRRGRLRWRLLPSTSPAEPAFEPDNYWRGPVWPVINWLLRQSLSQLRWAAPRARTRSAATCSARSPPPTSSPSTSTRSPANSSARGSSPGPPPSPWTGRPPIAAAKRASRV